MMRHYNEKTKDSNLKSTFQQKSASFHFSHSTQTVISMKFGVVSSLLMACLAAAAKVQAGEHVSKEQGSSSHDEATTTCQDLADSTQCQVWAMSGEW